MLASWLISLLLLCYFQVLVTNEFAVTSQLVGAPHPRAWKDSWRLAPNEVIFLLELGKRFVIGSVWVAFVCWYCYIGWKAMCRIERAPDPLRRRRVLIIFLSSCLIPLFCYQKSAQSADELLGMLNERPTNCTALSRGPLEALRHSGLHFKSKEERAKWTAEARLDAILGGCQASVGSVKSGLRCYLAFAGSYNWYSCCASSHLPFQLADALACKSPKVYFPPQLDTLLAWSTTFRSAGTLSNYLGYVKTGCLIVGASTEVGFACLLSHRLDMSLYSRYSNQRPWRERRCQWKRSRISHQGTKCGSRGAASYCVRYQNLHVIFESGMLWKD